MTRHDAAMLFVCLIWGANFTITKLAFVALTPLAFTALRFIAGTVLLFAVVRLVEGPLVFPKHLWKKLLWLGVVGNTLYQLGFVLGLANSTATNTSLIISASPAVVAILGAALNIEHTTPRVRAGIALGILGVVIVVLARAKGVVHAAAGDLFSVGAVIAWGFYTVGLRTVQGLSPLQITAWTTLAGTPLLVLAAIPELSRVRWEAVGTAGWGGLGYAIVLSLIVGYLLWNRSIRAVGATRTAIYMCVTPLVALLVAWFALGETPSVWHPVGGVLIAAGVVLTRLR